MVVFIDGKVTRKLKGVSSSNALKEVVDKNDVMPTKTGKFSKIQVDVSQPNNLNALDYKGLTRRGRVRAE